MITITILTTIMSLFINHHFSSNYNVINTSSHIIFQSTRQGNNFIQEGKKYQYLGAEKCASVCHNNDTMGYQYNSWLTSPHRESYSVLASRKADKYARAANIKENPQESNACLKCHITGADLDSSFLTATYKKDDGVTCEACHKHSYDGKTYIPKEEDCLQCHNESLHKINKFNFKEGNARLAHPRLNKKPSVGMVPAVSQ